MRSWNTTTEMPTDREGLYPLPDNISCPRIEANGISTLGVVTLMGVRHEVFHCYHPQRMGPSTLEFPLTI
jgi:hypothetical protein